MSRFLNRGIEPITVSEIYECFQLNKWEGLQLSEEGVDVNQQSSLMEVILNKYPSKSIIVQRCLAENSPKTFYRIIRGKEKVEMLIQYIESNLVGNSISHLFKNQEEADTFWSYPFVMEYIPSKLSDDELKNILLLSEI